MMIIVPYEKKYLDGIVNCLRRNFKWMGESDKETIREWVMPIVSFSWCDETEVSQDEYPYRHGAVVLEKDNVVGFFGLITAKRYIQNSKVIVVSATTWVLDQDFRLGFLDILKQLFSYDCFFADLSPSKSVELTLKHFFNFKEFCTIQYRLLPIPSNRNDVDVEWIDKENSISDVKIQNEYSDNIAFFGMNLIQFSIRESNDKGFLFYKKYNEPDERIRILKIYNKELFSKVCHEIVWKVYSKEKLNDLSQEESIGLILSNMYEKRRVCVECDEAIIGGYKLDYPYIKNRMVTRLYRAQMDYNDIDYLYSEMALLSCGL